MTEDIRAQVELLAKTFQSCSKVLTAIGDETRQYIIFQMMTMGDCSGVRVGDITMRSSLSRPAVSHHLKILKDAGIVKVRKEGTKNYYYFDTDENVIDELSKALALAGQILDKLPDRSEK